MILAKRTIAAAAIETTEGIRQSLSNVDCFRVSNLQFNPTVEMNPRPIFRQSLSKVPDLPGLRSATVSFDVELAGHSAAGTPPEWGKLMKGCGFAEAAGTGSVTYTLSSSSVDLKSLTLGVYTDGVITTVWGARGSVQIMLEAGKPGILRFNFTGADFAVEDGNLPAPSLDTSLPAAFREAVFTMDGQSLKIGMLTLSLNNSLELRKDVARAGGHLSAMIGGRSGSGEFDPEMELVAGHDFYGKWKNGELSALAAQWGTGTQKIALAAPKCQYSGIRWQNRGALRGLSVTFGLNEDQGSDELQLIVGNEE